MSDEFKYNDGTGYMGISNGDDEKLFSEIAAILEPHLSQEYNSRIGREDWNAEGLKSVSIGYGHPLYIAIRDLVNKYRGANK